MEEPNILIKTALSDAVQKVNEGMSPTAALHKVANDLDLNPNYIQRTGEALNVALHYKHFKTASDRSTEFEIADIPKVIQDVFTVAEKTASEYISEHFPGDESTDVVFNYNRMLSNPTYKQAFLEIAGAKEAHDKYDTTFDTVYSKSSNYIKKLEKDAELAEVEKVAAELDLNYQFSALADEFKKEAAYRTAFEEFESQVFAKHGEASLPYLELLHKTAAPKEERGVHDAGYMMFETCKEASLFDNLMKAAEEYIETAKKAEEVNDFRAFEAGYLKEAKGELGKHWHDAKCPECGCTVGRPKKGCNCVLDRVSSYKKAADKPDEEDADDQAMDPVLAEIKKKVKDPEYSVAEKYDKDPVLKEAMDKEAFGFGSVFEDLIQHPISEAFSHGFKAAPKKPNLTLENMERKLLLQELMITDPIISKANKAKVVRAYEQILRLSPEVSKQKEVVRAELRAMLATQALSKFDADMMTKLDTGMLKHRVMTHEFNKGETNNFRF